MMQQSGNPHTEQRTGQNPRNSANNQPLGEVFEDLSRMIAEEIRILDLEMRAAESALSSSAKNSTIRFLA